MKTLILALLIGSVCFAQGHQATITWAPNTATSTTDLPTQYNILRGTTSGGESATPIGNTLASACSPTTCTYIDSTVAGGQTYFYEITAQNSGGTSAPSPEVSVAIPLFPPGIPSKPTIVGK